MKRTAILLLTGAAMVTSGIYQAFGWGGLLIEAGLFVISVALITG